MAKAVAARQTQARRRRPKGPDLESAKPLYLQAQARIEDLIARENFSPDDQLPTVRQISSAIGISRATVANAINRMIDEGILVARQGKGIYVRKPADQPRSVKLRTVYILSPGRPSRLGLEDYMTHSPFWSQILNGVRQGIQASGETLRLRFSFLPDFLAEEDATPRQRRWDDVGFIVLQDPDNQEIQKLARLSRTIVQVHGISRSRLMDSVYVDCGLGAQMLVDHLVGLGHRRIAYCGSVTRRLRHFSLVDFEKLQGYWLRLEKHQIHLDPERYVRDCHFGGEEGCRAVQPLLAMPESERPTAILFCNDELAIGACRAIRDAGLTVPDDISVAGFDNMSMGRFFYPSLTTMALNMEKVGQLGIQRLLAIHEGGDRTTTVLSPELITRESTGPVKNM